jgi:uncharacterized protein (TIGR04255 family)
MGRNAMMVSKTGLPLPRFDMPPVVETVIGVEFAPLPQWDIPYFGMFWNEIKTEYPKFKVLPALGSQVESFERPLAKEVEVHLLDRPELRCWFIAEDDRTLMQVQSSRLIFNWKKRSSEDVYPHYENAIRPAFLREWNRFRHFVSEHKLGQLSVVQCEVAYVNHIEIGEGWTSAADINNVFPNWSESSSREFLPGAESVAFEVRYIIPDRAGRLRCSMQPAIRNSDGVEVLQLNVTARGEPQGSDDESLFAWIDMGREWVVRGFTDFTSTRMHEIWKRSQ